MHKYGILVYDYISIYQSIFDIISTPWDAVNVWPTELPIEVTDKQGQIQYQWPSNVYFKIVEDSEWGQTQTDAINEAVTNWNAANPDKLIPDTLQLIFTPGGAPGINQLFDDERIRLISL
jgi:hypothetical protein